MSTHFYLSTYIYSNFLNSKNVPRQFAAAIANCCGKILLRLLRPNFERCLLDVFFRKVIIEFWEINPWWTNSSIIGSSRDYFKNWELHPKDIKRALFHNKKVKKGTPNLTSPYVHSRFTLVLIKQIFEKNRSLRAASGSQTQF